MTTPDPAAEGSPPRDLHAQELLERASGLLHAAKERMTGPRKAVLLALLRRQDHASAEQLIATVHEIDPRVHQASVYRALEALSRCGLVQHVHLGHGATAYHLAHDHHPHAECTACGRVIDLPGAPFETLTGALLAESGFALDVSHVALSGTCADCASDAAS